MSSFDVIVIGSGIGGMVSAGILASQGLKTLLIEKNPSPGGYMTSFSRRGFVFDSAIDCIAGIGEDGIISRVLGLMGMPERVNFLRIDPIRFSIFPDFSVKVSNDLAEYIETLISLFPEEAPGIRELFRKAEEIYSAALSAVEMKIRGIYQPEKVPPSLIMAANTTYEALLNESVGDYRLRAALADRCPFIGLPPSQVSALSMANLIMSYFREGAYRPCGGFQTLSDIFIEGLRQKGAEVLFGKRVEKIITEGDRCTEVACEDGMHYRGRYIVSNADYYATLLSLSEERFKTIAEDMLRHPGVSKSFFIVYAGIRGGEIGYSSVGYFPSYDMEGFFETRKAFADDSTMGITVATIEDRKRAPEGCHTVVLHEMVEANGRVYNKEECTANMIGRAERVIPGLRDSIEVLDAATPQTLHRYTGNLHGAAFGWRQVPGIKNVNRHGIRNLYIAGHWGEFGGGVLAAAYSGTKAAVNILSMEGSRVEF